MSEKDSWFKARVKQTKEWTDKTDCSTLYANAVVVYLSHAILVADL